jgi:hypothetical protein
MSLLDNLPDVIKKIELSDVKASNQENNKPFLIVCSRELENSEVELIKHFGKTLLWQESYMNIPLSQHKFDYCIVDVNQKSHRMLLMKEDLDKYHVVCLVKWHEDSDDFIGDVKSENVMHHLPPIMPFKGDWDRLLLSKKIRKPNCIKALGRVFLKVLNGWSN